MRRTIFMSLLLCASLSNAETARDVIELGAPAAGLSLALALSHADMEFCGDSVAATEMDMNDAERTRMVVRVGDLARQQEIRLSAGVADGTLEAIRESTMVSYTRALSCIEKSPASKARFCDAARVRLDEVRKLRKQEAASASMIQASELDQKGKAVKDYIPRLLLVFVHLENGKDLNNFARVPAMYEQCGAPSDMFDKAKEFQSIKLANLEKVFAEEIRAEKGWPYAWLEAAQHRILQAFVASYRTGVMRVFESLDEKQSKRVCSELKSLN